MPVSAWINPRQLAQPSSNAAQAPAGAINYSSGADFPNKPRRAGWGWRLSRQGSAAAATGCGEITSAIFSNCLPRGERYIGVLQHNWNEPS